jgi:hypothetical protein
MASFNGRNMRSSYSSIIDELLEKGIWLSEFKRIKKEKFLKVGSLLTYVRYRIAQGWIFEIKKEGGDIFYRVVSKGEGSGYAKWMKELLRQGIWLSEYKKLEKEKYGVSFGLLRFVRLLRKRGYVIEERREGEDTFYKIVEVPRRAVKRAEGQKLEKEKREKREEVVKERKLVGGGIYVFEPIGEGKNKLFVRIGTESRVVEVDSGEEVKEVIERLFGVEVEMKMVFSEGEEKKGIFVCYKEV